MTPSRPEIGVLLCSLACALGAGGSLAAEAPLSLQWVTTEVPSTVLSLATDPSDDVYLFGSEANYTSVIQKYNDEGVLLWASAPDLRNNFETPLAVDNLGNATLAGYMWGTDPTYGGVHLGPWPKVGGGMVLVRYGAQGQVQWVQASIKNAIDSITSPDSLTSVVADAAGYLYATGQKNQKGPAYSFFGNPKSVQDVVDSQGAILMRFDSAGQPQWVTLVSNASTAYVRCLAVDGASNAYVVGTFAEGTVDFGDSVRVISRSSVGNYVLIKYDAAGKALWARSIEHSGGRYGLNALSVDRLGNTYLAGTIHGKTLLDFGNSVTVTGSSAVRSPLLVKLDATGEPQWALSPNMPKDDESMLLVRAGAAGTYAITLGGVLQAYDPAGALRWELRLPGEGWIRVVALDRWENVYVAGRSLNQGLTDLGNGFRVRVNKEFVAKYENTSFAPMKRAIATQPGVRVRSRGDLQADTLGSLDRGDLVIILEQSQQKMKVQSIEDYWYQVKRAYDGLTGWSYGFFLEMEPS